jgi:hypothetical protein
MAVGRARIGAGGSLFVSSGSRPTEYYQPLLRLVVPLHQHLAWRADWCYHGFGEIFYPTEGFRAHLVTVGLRLIWWAAAHHRRFVQSAPHLVP